MKRRFNNLKMELMGMGYFDGIVDKSFKTADDGTMLFYPWGVLGKGYVLPDVEKKRETRNRVKRYSQAMLLLVILAGMTINFLFLNKWVQWFLVWLVFVVGVLLVERLFKSHLTKGLSSADTKLSLFESYRNAAHSYSLSTLWLLELGCLLFVGSGILIIYWALTGRSASSGSILAGLVGIIFFGYFGIVYGYMIKVKDR